ncbi:MAG: DUF6531 domain-containing protein [Acidobacteriota bacterium]|nr:DUF6531 domain-containing protein [Acidobacteriota bacterium]
MASKGTGKVAVGHPVDVATGTLFHDFEDYVLPGRMPLIFGRRYSSALVDQASGMFGQGWASPFEMRVRHDLDGYHMIAEDGETEIEFDDPDGIVESGETVRNLGAFYELRQEQAKIIVTRWNPDSQDITRYIFPVGQDGEWWHLASRQDIEGQGIDIERDAGRVMALKQRREGRGYRLVYNREGHVVEVYLTTLINESVGGDSQTRQPERLVLRYDYDSDNRLAEFVDALGNRCSYQYDTAGRMTREVNIGGMVFQFRYDAKGRCIETTGLDDFGRNTLEIIEVAKLTQVTDSLGHVTTYQWNENGQVEREISPLGNVASTIYDEHGRIIQKVKPGGATTSYEYDDRGDRVKETSPTGAATIYEYNEQHQVIGITDPTGHQWHRSYTSSGRVATVTNPLGNTLSYSYNSQGDLVEFEDSANHKRRFAWDEFGNLESISNPLGHTTRYEHDPEGHVIGVVDPLGHRTEIRVDALGRIYELRLPDGATRRFARNVYDQLTQYVDELGAVTRWRYTACGLLTEEIRPHGGRIQLEWSTIPGQLLSITNERGENHAYEYDADNRMIQEIDFAGRPSRYVYNQDGDIVVVKNAANHRVEFTRDAAGALTAVSHQDGSRTTYEYDVRGLLIKADNGDCPVEREYDAVGRLVVERQGGHEVTSEYDTTGNRIRRRSSLGHKTAFEWNPNNQIARLIPNSYDAIHFEYDPRQKEASRFVTGGVQINQNFDSRGRSAEQWVASAGGLRTGRIAVGGNSSIHRRYRYDAASNLTELLDDRWGATRYAYDVVGRITTTQLPKNFTERFTYDATHNIVALERSDNSLIEVNGDHRSESSSWQYQAGNQLVNRDGMIYEYNALGQLARKTGIEGETIYTWDSHGQLANVTLPNGSEWKYKYDPFGRRVEKRGSSRHVEFVWDGDVVLHEISSNGDEELNVINWEFDPYGFAPIAKTEGRAQYLCVNDVAGAPRELVTSDGAVAWRAQFTTFGEMRASSVTEVDCPVRFQGQWYDDETGLHYNRFRYYDPAAGRYVSRDPIGISGGLNVFTYARNPTRWIDPYGLTGPCPPLDMSIVKKGETREEHIRRHEVDNPSRTVPHGVFMEDGVPATHEAWQRAHDLGISPDPTTGVLTVPMGRDIGLMGGQPGAAANHPILTNVTIFLVPGTNQLVTAFPS